MSMGLPFGVMKMFGGTSLVVQWVRLRTPNAGGPGLIPGWGTRSCMPQLRVRMLKLNLAQPKNK